MLLYLKRKGWSMRKCYRASREPFENLFRWSLHRDKCSQLEQHDAIVLCDVLLERRDRT